MSAVAMTRRAVSTVGASVGTRVVGTIVHDAVGVRGDGGGIMTGSAERASQGISVTTMQTGMTSLAVETSITVETRLTIYTSSVTVCQRVDSTMSQRTGKSSSARSGSSNPRVGGSTR